MNLDDDTLKKMEKQIDECEKNLVRLRKEYMAKTGHMPLKKLNDFEWKWTIFMSVGFAFISMVVYLLGIRKAGKGTHVIPSFYFSLDLEYFAVLTFYALIMVLMVQSRKLSGFQSMALILGFWCAHWLVYDWGWYFYLIGIREVQPNLEFWLRPAGRDFLVVDSPIWLFLTEAIIGGCLALYTLTFPRSKRHLIPPFIWLYAVYANATILEVVGLNAVAILIVAVVLLCGIFGSIVFFIIQRIRSTRRRNAKQVTKAEKNGGLSRKHNFSLDPLGKPFAFVMISMVALTNLVLVLNPAVGLLFGMIPWYAVPSYYILINSTGIAKSKQKQKIAGIIILTALFVTFLVAACLLPLGDYI